MQRYILFPFLPNIPLIIYPVHIPPPSATVWIKRQPACNEHTGCMIQWSYIKVCNDLPPIESRAKIHNCSAPTNRVAPFALLPALLRCMLARLVVSSVAIVTSVVIAPITHRCSLRSELLGDSIPAASPALFRLVWPACFSRSNGLPSRSRVVFVWKG